MSNEIRECPFCGSAAKHFYRHEASGFSNTDWVCCTNEDCGCGTCLHETKEQALLAWNRRDGLTAAPASAAEQLLNKLKRQMEDLVSDAYRAEKLADKISVGFVRNKHRVLYEQVAKIRRSLDRLQHTIDT